MRDLTHRIGSAGCICSRPLRHRDILFTQKRQGFRVLHGEIHILRNIARLPRYLASIEFGNHHANHLPAHIQKRPTGIARLHRRADLKMALIIGKPGKGRDLSGGQRGAG